MKEESWKVYEGENLNDVLKRELKDEKNPMIPSNIILNKVLPGLGATHSELHSKRSSIIIEPNVPVILGKLDKEGKFEAVYKHQTPHKLEEYLKMDIPHKKILTTPESFSKIRKAAQKLNIDIYKEYFCLFDECEKLVQDVDYRRRITQPIYDFFQFERKAFVSATPLEMRHPGFEAQGFKVVKIDPQFVYKKDMELIVTNSYDASLIEKLESLKDCKCICVFLNKTDAINKIIDTLGIANQSKVFCSSESVEKLEQRSFINSYEFLDLPLAKYNFFTSRFFSALDIKITVKPDILILTNLNEGLHTMIDPKTEAIQIYGRFRNKFPDGKTFNSLTVISNISPDLSVLTDDEMRRKIEQFTDTYNSLKVAHSLQADEIKKQALSQDMRAIKYSDLLDERGDVNYFSVDNLYNEERVKGYYTSKEALKEAYESTGHFNVSYKPQFKFIIGEDDLLKMRNLTGIKQRESITGYLHKLRAERDQNNSFDYEYFINRLEQEAEGKYTIEAYNKIGFWGMKDAGFEKGKIDKAIKEYDKEQLEKHRFAPETIKAISDEFELRVYINKNEIKSRLQNIYDRLGIKFKVTQPTIEDYYEHKKSSSINGGSYKLERLKLEIEGLTINDK